MDGETETLTDGDELGEGLLLGLILGDADIETDELTDGL